MSGGRGRIREIPWFGGTAWELCCPGCGEWGRLDDDMLHGRVSVDHTSDGCTFHETRDWFASAPRVEATHG